ncbi:hypothetical protein KKF91_06180 [Myxococcota bacterium]|nr:hypothetical protein [Myxococcota bacterium]MBU1430140.1 hypothetical protein [Myxococcota bacterium]MBU1900651.1 hypothetical protein [Myxococcota bacterium]
MSDTKRSLSQRLRRLVAKIYAGVLVLVLCWTGFMAVRYLIAIVTQPLTVPPALLQTNPKLDVASLRGPQAPRLPGLQARAPISHFHKGRDWRPFEPHNGCTAEGCHSPLPHSQAMKLPTFANFHVTALDCRACHTKATAQPTPMVWINKATSAPQGIPAILALTAFLSTQAQAAREAPAEHQGKLLGLLKAVLDTHSFDPVMVDLYRLLQTVEPGSPVWRSTLDALAQELSSNIYGEYAARLAPAALAEGLADDNEALLKQAADYRDAPTGSAARKEIIKAVHEGVLAQPPGCASCHIDKPGAVDFEAVGFTPQRSAMLHNLRLAELMEQIRKGEKFYLPQLLGTE